MPCTRAALGLAAVAALGFTSFTFAAGGIQHQGFGGNGGLPVGGPDAATYLLEDGTAEDSVGLNSATPNDLIWMNTFTVVPGAERITSIDVQYGTPAFPGGALNGAAVQVLLYQDADGGDPSNGVLVSSANGVIANADTNIFNTYALPGGGSVVAGNFAVGVIIRNNTTTNGGPFPAGMDTTDPDLVGRSWIGFGAGGSVNTANLAGSIPAAQRGFIEAFGLPGNWMVRANGVEVPEPASLGLLGLGAVALIRRRRA